MPAVAVTIYTRADCSLCVKAKASIAASGVEATVEEVDVDSDAELRRLYTNDVPVIFVDGIEAFRHFVTPAAFADYVNRR